MTRPPPNIWPIPLVDDSLFLDNSSQESCTTCPRAAGFKLCHKRESNKSRSPLEFGRIIHKALEARYQTDGSYLSHQGTAAMVRAIDQGFSTYTPDQDDYRNYSVAASFVTKYSSVYPFEDFEVFKFPDGSQFIEQPFAIPLGTISFNADLWVREKDGTIRKRYVGTITVVQKGKIDLAFRREGGLYGMDHKTTSMMGPSFFAEFELASQVHCYSWAMEHLCGELPRGFVINGLGIRKPTPSGKPLEFIRHVVPIYPTMVAEWKTDTLQITSDFIEHMHRANETGVPPPKHTKWCVGKYGACEYKPVCGLEPQYRDTSLYSNEYRDVTWDPLTD